MRFRSQILKHGFVGGGAEVKTIGLLGGMSWESSIEYYRIINELVREKLGSTHSAKSVMVSVDFAEIESLQREGKWKEATEILIASARQVESGGADFLLICTNTMHKMADEIADNITIPLLHIADATAEEIKLYGLHRIGLLGTKYTMEDDFYKGRLIEKYQLDIRIPKGSDRQIIHRIIYEELILGIISDDSKKKYIDIISDLVSGGAEGIILGCTEIGLLVGQQDFQVPLFDTAFIHAQAAVERALE